MATENTTPPAPQAEPDAYDSMASVFDELVIPETNTPMEETPPSTPEVDGQAPTPEPTSDATPAPAAPTGDTPSPATTPPVTEPTAPAAEGTTPPASAEPSPEAVDWKARFEELEARTKEQAAAPTPEPAAQPEPELPVYTDEEKSFIAQYEKDWPDITKAEALKRKAEYQYLVKHVFSEVNRVWGPLLERGSAAAETVAENETINYIRSTHDDYDESLYNDVHKWVAGLTGIRRKIAEATITEGEPQDVIDLITEFKTATGRKPRVVADAAPAPASAPVASVTEISAAAKKAASAMSVVDSKRTVVVQATDPNDFDGAWDEAVGSK